VSRARVQHSGSVPAVETRERKVLAPLTNLTAAERAHLAPVVDADPELCAGLRAAVALASPSAAMAISAPAGSSGAGSSGWGPRTRRPLGWPGAAGRRAAGGRRRLSAACAGTASGKPRSATGSASALRRVGRLPAVATRAVGSGGSPASQLARRAGLGEEGARRARGGPLD
jgi:hypothetical protein